MAKRKSELDEKALYEWAEERLFSDEVPVFLQFCKQDMYEPSDPISYGEFLILQEKFENRI